MALALDTNQRTTEISQSDYAGGVFEETVNYNAWQSLMPTGTIGTLAADGASLQLGTVRDDIDALLLAGWWFAIIEPGYEQRRRIVGVDGPRTNPTIRFERPLDISERIPANADYCLWPVIDTPLHFMPADTAHEYDIGYMTTFTTLATANVHRIAHAITGSNAVFRFPNRNLHRLAFRARQTGSPTTPPATLAITFAWGTAVWPVL